MNTREDPTIRCGYCNRNFPIVQSKTHWTWSLCNLRPVDQR